MLLAWFAAAQKLREARRLQAEKHTALSGRVLAAWRGAAAKSARAKRHAAAALKRAAAGMLRGWRKAAVAERRARGLDLQLAGEVMVAWRYGAGKNVRRA